MYSICCNFRSSFEVQISENCRVKVRILKIAAPCTQLENLANYNRPIFYYNFNF